jgi:hypothetical protein
MKKDSAYPNDKDQTFADALRKVATASPSASRSAIDDSKSTKPSLHKRFVYDPAAARD